MKTNKPIFAGAKKTSDYVLDGRIPVEINVKVLYALSKQGR